MTFKDQLLAAQRRLKKVQASFAKTLLFEKGKRYDLAYEQAFDFAYEAEKLTLLARVIPAYTGHPRFKERMEAQVAKAIPISIDLTPEGWFNDGHPGVAAPQGARQPGLHPRKSLPCHEAICGSQAARPLREKRDRLPACV